MLKAMILLGLAICSFGFFAVAMLDEPKNAPEEPPASTNTNHPPAGQAGLIVRNPMSLVKLPPLNADDQQEQRQTGAKQMHFDHYLGYTVFDRNQSPAGSHRNVQQQGMRPTSFPNRSTAHRHMLPMGWQQFHADQNSAGSDIAVEKREGKNAKTEKEKRKIEANEHDMLETPFDGGM